MTGAASAAERASPPAPHDFLDPAAIADAHAKVRADTSIQFDFPWFKLKQDPPPEWLLRVFRAIGRGIEWVGKPGWRIILIVLAICLAAVLLFALVPPARDWLRGLLARRRPEPAADTWMPQATVARELLDEADALAAQGEYDRAVHLILQRSIADIERWRSDVVRPSLTSRDIARADALPDHARGVFGRIAALVERSLFAGRSLGATDWQAARADYASFALGGA
jgi:hypothetical protein